MIKNNKNPNTPRLWDKLLFDKNYELLHSPVYQDKINKVFKFLKRRKGKLLDIGFGRGNLEKKLIQHKLPINVFGIDISTKTVELANKELGGKYKVGNIFKIPFESSFFDFVVVLDVIEHIYKDRIEQGYKEIKRVLKRSGDLVISVPLNENIDNLNHIGKNYNKHLREYTLKILSNELVKAGFKIVRYEYLVAFRKFYKPKSFIVKFVPFLKKPNLLIVYCKVK